MQAILDALVGIFNLLSDTLSYLVFAIEYLFGFITLPLMIVQYFPAVLGAGIIIGLVILIVQVIV